MYTFKPHEKDKKQQQQDTLAHFTTVMLMFFTDGCATRKKAVFEVI